jgi:hypothetical protein
MENLSERNLIILIITRYVARVFFNKDRWQAVHWLNCSNINFNGISPKQMILDGKGDRVFDFIESRLYDIGETD